MPPLPSYPTGSVGHTQTLTAMQITSNVEFDMYVGYSFTLIIQRSISSIRLRRTL
jgi:hypothetical protein